MKGIAHLKTSIKPCDVVTDCVGHSWDRIETGHLDATRGYGNYMTMFRSGMEKLFADQRGNQPFDEGLIRRIDAACQEVTPAAEVPERQRWRDA